MATRSAVRTGRLNWADLAPLQHLLDAEPVHNAYLRSELRQGLDGGDWWGVRDGDCMRAALLAGSLAVPCLSSRDDAALLAESACASVPPRMLVGPRGAVMALRDELTTQRPREVRDPQPLLTLGRDDELPQAPNRVRLATRADIDGLVTAAAAMHREEMGVDPLTVDAAAWRARMVTLIDHGWSWVWGEGGDVLFKAELSAWTPEAVQIQGVYTHPGRRGQGIARAGLAAVCRSLLEQVPVCSLYVNHYNTTALRLYDRLGFHRAGDFATVIY